MLLHFFQVNLFDFVIQAVDISYKNLLQEIAQKESSLLPVYATLKSGPSNAPSFTSTVKFAGNVYIGEEAKTKKLTERSAAKVAFMSIKCGMYSNFNIPCLFYFGYSPENGPIFQNQQAILIFYWCVTWDKE